MFIYSNTAANLLFVETTQTPKKLTITDLSGKEISCATLGTAEKEGGFVTTLDASNLKKWSIDEPVLYNVSDGENTQRFGHSSLSAFQNKFVLLNDAPIYLRGFIRGIVAHDHPNMTGLSDYEAAKKNISQAKKYGFNLVRFHSTIPTEDFMRAADELGILVHIEIGFAYDYDSDGNKQNLSVNNGEWENTILKYRNHPSLAICCVGNELHNSGHYPEVKVLYNKGKALAPNKLIMDNSGWGEFDRSTADVFSQHIAYFFPYAHHADMFNDDAHWMVNGSAYDAKMNESYESDEACVEIDRRATAIRPTLSHEAMHYIDIPDYEALNRKFDEFASRVGEDYLKEKGIKKPRYLTELPALIEKKGLKEYMPDYMRASRAWKLMAMKVFMERLRQSELSGYEMLQFSDCLKYENKNGIVDLFDDDKGIDAAWLRTLNSDLVVLADLEKPYCYEGESIKAVVYASDFLPKAEVKGDLTVKLDGKTVYEGKDFVLAGGLQQLVSLDLKLKTTGVKTLSAEFVSEDVSATNEWEIWVYPEVEIKSLPELDIKDGALKNYLLRGGEKTELYVTDSLNDKLFEKLERGKTAVLLYEHLSERNTWQLQGALERFKPCIWDRGSNLGGIVKNEAVKNAVQGELFDLNMQPLLEAGYKVNLDNFPVKTSEQVLGVDKPVRDRMKGLIAGIKDFIAEDTLRKFSHLFSLNVGAGRLIVCTFNLSNPANPVVANFLKVLIDSPEVFNSESAISAADLIAYLEKINAEGIRREDVMNHFWEIDDKLVEDTLFWEEAQVDLAKMEPCS
ncbi:MAG: hypothetical protein IJ027_08125 [Oscillospiraceae bacterium]|nr:hypothetical protein [Oscillospiraceae bacterium]